MTTKLTIILFLTLLIVCIFIIVKADEEQLGGVPCKDDQTKTVNARIKDCPIPPNERASLKGKEIAKLNNVKKTKRAKYDIEITSFKAIEGGVEVLVRAWDKNGQIGFGKDGTVDIERFVIINPPILVDDPNGDIIREYYDEIEKKIVQRRLREDLKEALLQDLEHTISVKKEKFDDSKIVSGKVGNTTLTAHPSAGSNTPFDGRLLRDGDNSTWATIRAETTSNFNSDSDTTLNVQIRTTTTTNQYQRLYRILFGFTTSSISTDTISSATFSVFAFLAQDFLSQSVALDHTIPNSTSGTTNTDFNTVDWDNTDNATARISMGSWDIDDYQNFTLNSTGIANIDKDGLAWFGLRGSSDIDNSAPTWASDTSSRASFHTADYAGTTSDPKLVVEHSAPAVSLPSQESDWIDFN